MAIKQHCDICDNVIPGDESFRVIRYGRGQNLDVQTGNDPKIICKGCWGKMWAAVSTGEPKNIDDIGKDFLSKSEARRYKQAIDQNSDTINNMHKILKSVIGTSRTCATCYYSDQASQFEPCNKCSGCDQCQTKEQEKE